MNPVWGFFFKDRYRTPFSIYRMSLAEVVFLGAIIFGVGFGITTGVKAILDFETTETIDESV